MAQLVKQYYSGQGMVYAAPFVGGTVQTHKARWIGNVPNLELAVEVEELSHKESHSGSRLKDFTLRKELAAKFKLTMEDFSTDNLAMAFAASVAVVPKGKVTDETSPTDLAVGDNWLLSKQKIAKLVIKDSTSSPVTLQVGMHYSVDETFGRVEIFDVSGLKLPLLATFEHEAADVLDLLVAKTDNYYLRFEGLNTADGNRPVLVEIFKASVPPAKMLSLINDELASFELEGDVLLYKGATVRVTKL
ncbi:hypothetical protein [Kingella negevensis]|uniref:phage tail tube protein n=1 Tax=Kingella negevensis TaxID=1522312 RepID=UPI0005C63467|nr:hypothetical protein [Kingella negevensis]MDK4689698.1 hypothetical protein [Kingella negevensis]WII91767.1 hypothetical protein QEO93_04060 [Kingella negevensis]